MLSYKEYLKAYAIIIIITFFSMIPYVNFFLLNHHNGPGFILVLISMPYFLFNILKSAKKLFIKDKLKSILFIIYNFFIYSLISIVPAYFLTSFQKAYSIYDFWIIFLLGPIILVWELIGLC